MSWFSIAWRFLSGNPYFKQVEQTAVGILAESIMHIAIAVCGKIQQTIENATGAEKHDLAFQEIDSKIDPKVKANNAQIITNAINKSIEDSVAILTEQAIKGLEGK